MTSHKPMPITEELRAWIRMSSAVRVGRMIICLIEQWETGSVPVLDRDVDASFREVFSIFSAQLARIKKGEK